MQLSMKYCPIISTTGIVIAGPVDAYTAYPMNTYDIKYDSGITMT